MKSCLKVLTLCMLLTLLHYPILLQANESSTEVVQESPEAKQNTEQLKGYQDFTKWLLENEDGFEKVIEETSKESKTKWFIQEEIDNISQEETKPVEKIIEHTVLKGDTLYSISKKYKTTTTKIISDNKLNNNEIKLGQKLKIEIIVYEPLVKHLGDKQAMVESEEIKEIPIISQKESEIFSPEKIIPKGIEVKIDPEISYANLPDYKTHKVKKGDTLFSVAKQHNMTKEELVLLNEIDDKEVISVDMILKVKSNYKASSQTQSAIAKDGFLWPVVGRLLIQFGPQPSGLTNEGVNISAKKGTVVKAVQDGVVTYVGSALSNFGNLILIQHNNDWVSAYAHLDSSMVTKGQRVQKGDTIARVGNSGNVKQPQLHFELRYQIKPMDPLVYLNSYR